MAEQKQNIIQIKGSLGGFTFYKLNGKNVVRKTTGPSKETINNNPAYKKTKNNNSEFAGATYLSKNIRRGLGDMGKQFQDTYMASRLTGVCRAIIANGKGEHGKRTGDLLKNPKLLVGFPLSKNKLFRQKCLAKYSLNVATNRDKVNIVFPLITPTDHQQIPKIATHFKITFASVSTAPLCYDDKTNKYKSPFKSLNNLENSITTNLFKINQNYNNINLSLLTSKNHIPKNTAISVWLGISYFQKTNNEVVLLKNIQAMQCVSVL